jgi:micrococcal nuclease
VRRLLTAFALAAVVAGCAEAAPSAQPGRGSLPVPAGAQEAVVVTHTDGDTFWLRGVGVGPVPARRTKVRLLEVDTPEVFGTKGCYGAEAARRTAELLPLGAHVHVETDRDLRDRYGRLLLYVWTPTGVSLEEALLRDGYARTLLVRPNDRHIATFRAAEAEARQAKRGLWGRCDRRSAASHVIR